MAETELERCLKCVVRIYHQYSTPVDHYDMLSKRELGKLIKQQLPNIVKNAKDPKVIDGIFEELDTDGSKQLSFGEFMPFLTKVLIAALEHIHERDD